MLAEVMVATKKTRKATQRTKKAAEEEASERIAATLIRYGLLPSRDKAICDSEQQMAMNKKYYQNTKMLLREYRGLIWKLRSIPAELASELDVPLDDLRLVLEAVNSATTDNKLMSPYRATSLNRTMNMVKHINDSMLMLQSRPIQTHEAGRPSPTGEHYYQALKLTYIDCKQLSKYEIMARLGEMFPGRNGEQGAITSRTYYRWCETAITILGDLLWGNSSPEINAIFDIYEGLTDVVNKQKEKECDREPHSVK